MKEGSLWGWMSQLYSIRSSGSWGIGDYEDLKTLLVESKKKTGADFMLINPLHAAEPVPPIEPSPYLPISRRFINFSYIRPESMPEYAVLSPEDKAKVDELHKQVKPLNGNARILDRETMWRTKMQALWIIYKSGLSAQRQAEFDQYLAEVGDEIESYAHGACATTSGAPRMAATTIGCASTIVIPRKSRSFAHSTRTRLNSIVGSNGSPPSSCMRPSRRRARPHEDRHRRRHGCGRASGRFRRVVEPGAFCQGRHGRRSAGHVQPAGSGLESAAAESNRSRTDRLQGVPRYGARHVLQCGRGTY